MSSYQAEIERAIVNTVSYVDAFDYPLTAAEIHRYLVGLPLSPEKVQQALGHGPLIRDRLGHADGFYMLPGREDMADLRRQRQAVANRLWPEAARYGSLIAHAPFVRMVAVTGSLAVNNVTHEDIDYLIVTANDRLWVCRAFVILIVRWAARRGLELCPNYFLTERALRFSQQNLYTAHEVAQMVPLNGRLVYETLRRVNAWTYRYLPNAAGAPSLPSGLADLLKPATSRYSPVRVVLEAALHTRAGRWFDQWEMSRKMRKFRKIYAGQESSLLEASFSSDSCKGHFNLHQQRTMRAYHLRTAGESRSAGVQGSGGAGEKPSMGRSPLSEPAASVTQLSDERPTTHGKLSPAPLPPGSPAPLLPRPPAPLLPRAPAPLPPP
jgi:hypothetical protein